MNFFKETELQDSTPIQKSSTTPINTAPESDKTMSRRGFFKVTAVLGGGLTPEFFDLSALAQAPTRKPDNPLAFITLKPDNTAHIIINRLEFGQGVNTALAMLVAEELDMPMSRMTSSLAPNDPTFNDPFFGMQMTGGSNTIANSWVQYRTIGASLKALLVQAAAQKWKTTPDKIKATGGTLSFGKNKATYASLAEDASKLTVPEKIVLKNAKDFKIIGKAQRRLDGAASSTGEKIYGIDYKADAVAVVARPPTFDGGRPLKFNAEKAKAVKGVLGVFEVPTDRGGTGIAVVAKGYWQAKLGRDALDVEWQAPKAGAPSSEKLFEMFKQEAKSPQKLARPFPEGVTEATLNSASRKISAEFTFPYLSHAALEPLNCTAEIKGDVCQITGGTQMPGLDAGRISKALGFAADKVKVNVLPSGGGFGRRAVPTSEFVVEAAQVAKKWSESGGKGSVKVMWSREDDIRGGYYRPMHVHRAEIGMNDKGEVVAWDHSIVGQSILKGSAFEGFLVKDGIDSTMTEGVVENDYNLPLRVRISHPDVQVPVLWWRSVGHTHTAYVKETLVDEIAKAIGKDPVAFRMERLDPKAHKREREALKLAVEKSGYGKRKLAKGHAWGVAVHKSFNTSVAYVVVVYLKDSKPIVHEVFAGVHCNKVVNPMTAAQQIEGGMLFGMSMLLPGAAITLKDGAPVQSQLTEFQLPRMPDAPKNVHVHFVPSEDAPTGLGEPGTPPIAPAIANALAALTGKRYRDLPFQLGS